MLKIKDNVDLKELEKFGFKPKAEDEQRFGWQWDGTVLDRDLFEIDTFLFVYPDCDMSGYPEGQLCARWIITAEGSENKLFDLIQAGLVEKVKSKRE